MKYLLAFALLVTVATCFKHDDELWKKFKGQFNREYSSTRLENKRRAIFEHHVDVISAHNIKYDLGLTSYKMGINEYSDLSNVEFRTQMNGYRNILNQNKKQEVFYATNEELPASVNWADKGAVTDIKNQAQCGSCWAFSTTGSIEGQHFLKTKQLVSLSEQNLMDCSRAEGNMGCSGGLMDQAFAYVIKNNGIDTEDSYPYTAKDGTCSFKPEDIGATISSYKDVNSGDEIALQTAVASVGPISVAIDAGHDSFQHYSSGVYDEPECSSVVLDHGVLAVGYDNDAESGNDYWLVKNSWGKTWGLTGYIKMSRNKNNQCGIATKASYPII